MTLAEFLLARLAEDEVATLGLECACEDGGPQLPSCPARILNEVDAKRRIVRRVSNVKWATYAVRDEVLELLALPYADHSDYDPDWCPVSAKGRPRRP